MAKKSGNKAGRAQRRQVAYRGTQARAEAPVATRVEEPTETRSTKAPEPRPAPAATATGLRAYSSLRRHAATPAPVPTDYSYVRRDLARIAILTAIILIFLVALTFVLR